MSIVARFFPNGEFTHGVDTSRARKERKHKECRHEPLTQECRDGYLQWVRTHPDASSHLCVPGQSYEDTEGRLWVFTHEDKGNYYYDCLDPNGSDVLGIQMNYPIGRLIGDGRFSPLVHQTVESSPLPPNESSDGASSRKRLERMTKSMARNIRNAAYMLDTLYGKDNISFLTLTLPDLSAEDLGRCCERWDYLVDQMLKALRKRIEKHGFKFQYVYCTEIQTKRLRYRGEYAPHLHIAFRGRYARKNPWVVSPKQVRKAWSGIIRHTLGHGDFTDSALENLQRVKKSVARYLSKYLSKGSCCLPSEGGSVVSARLGTQWGGMARSLSRLIRACTARISNASSHEGLAVGIIRHADELIKAGLIRYYKQGYIVISSHEDKALERVLKVGCGCLSTPTYAGGLLPIATFLQGMGYGCYTDPIEQELDRCSERRTGGDTILKICIRNLTDAT